MGRRSRKTTHKARPSPSEHRLNGMYKLGQTLSAPLAEYRGFIDTLRVYGTTTPEALTVPLHLIDLTASLIASLISGHDVTPRLVSATAATPTSSDPTQQNTTPEFNFIRRILARSKLSCTTFLLGLFFVSRSQAMSKRAKPRPTPSNFPRSPQATVDTKGTIPTFLASVICADKYLYDATYTNADWAVFTDGRYSTQDINIIEADFLKRIDFKLFFLETDYLAFLDNLDLMICLRQIYRWSSLSYTDLYRLSSTIQPVFQWQLSPKMRSGDAVLLLIKFLTNYVVSYLVALATAIAAASLVHAVMLQGAAAVSFDKGMSSANPEIVLDTTMVSLIPHKAMTRQSNHTLMHNNIVISPHLSSRLLESHCCISVASITYFFSVRPAFLCAFTGEAVNANLVPFATVDATDRQILAAINAVSDPDAEKSREQDETDDYDLAPPLPLTSTHSDLDNYTAHNPKLARILQDQQIRQSLNSSGPQTGPKGVLADYRFHTQQEMARKAETTLRASRAHGKGALSSGWMQRQIVDEEAQKRGDIAKAEGGKRADNHGPPNDDERERENYEDALEKFERQVEDLDIDDPFFMQQYRAKRMAELEATNASTKRVFGVLRELDGSNYVSAIDSEPDNVTVVIHLYQSAVEACRLTNTYLTQLAKKYGLVKFCRIVSTTADENFDLVALPALLVYRGGDLIHSFIRITDDIPGWRNTGRIDMEDFEEYLLCHRVVNDSEVTDFDINLFASRKMLTVDDEDDDDLDL
ncbi:hypothetical protein SeLEV6574_g06622 [Synchytrium endobioticum]|uniref:Phosducin domain-containing protein n=1 Tax=Synchytrium endobioticum TaxID=286115 RepID=A0A507CL56_9FUNG|nr:hypothetical protein SeLEV6574_g06622 [Synchytrium endobioticum]